MKLLFTLDKKDYSPEGTRVVRHAVRGIVKKEGGVVLIRSQKYGEYKFPGGGMKEGESVLATLYREVREETGLTVLLGSAREWGKTVEIRKGRGPDEIYEQHSYYCFCDTGEKVGPTALDDYEKEYGYKMETVPLARAIEINRDLTGADIPSWVERDTRIMEMLREDE